MKRNRARASNTNPRRYVPDARDFTYARHDRRGCRSNHSTRIHTAMLKRTLNRFFKKRVIVNCDHDPYLYRWYLLRLPWFHVLLHKFVRSDEDRALHDHPWNFLVIPLWRGYLEHNEKGVRNVLPFLGTRVRGAEYRHRVELRDGKPAWSLFISFKRRRIWGFWPEKGFVAWNQWWKDNKCE